MLAGKAALWEAGAGAVTWLSPPISSPSVQKLLDVYFSRILFFSWHLQSSEPAQQTSLGQEACCLQGAPQSSDFVGSVQWWELEGRDKVLGKLHLPVGQLHRRGDQVRPCDRQHLLSCPLLLPQAVAATFPQKSQAEPRMKCMKQLPLPIW